jgi:2-methylfumaryl-CoA hydratase
MSETITKMDYGRQLDDFVVGDCYLHPFEVTVDEAIVGPYCSSFIDATPLWSSDRAAQALGLKRRPVPPHLLLNLGLSFSVHDTSQQAIAHLAYVRVEFPKPLLIGGTIRAASRVLETRPSSTGDKGVVRVQTVLVDEDGQRVLDFERMALIRGGNLARRPQIPGATSQDDAWLGALPARTFASRVVDVPPGADFFRPPLFGTFEDLTPGRIFVHANGRTVGHSEHMRLSATVRNTHPLHWDDVYCQTESFKRERVVYGGLVLAWTLTQASIDLGGHILWEERWSDGSHPAPVLGGDTLFAATRIVSARALSEHVGVVEMRVVGVKNTRPEALLDAGVDLFMPERDKPRDGRIADKVVEITRSVLVRRRLG